MVIVAMRAQIATTLRPRTAASTGCLVVRGVVHDGVAVVADCPGMVFELSTTAVDFELMSGDDALDRGHPSTITDRSTSPLPL